MERMTQEILYDCRGCELLAQCNERGIPNYTVGHLGRVGAIYDRLAAYPGLHLNSNAYRGIGLNDCVANARSCAEQVLKQG